MSLTVPDIADAMVTAPTQLLIHGKQPGTISLFVWDRAGAIKTYEVKVRRDLTPLIGHPSSCSRARPSRSWAAARTSSSSAVSSRYVTRRPPSRRRLRRQEGERGQPAEAAGRIASNQVMLRVRFAEVSRSALQELGATYVANGSQDKWFGRHQARQFLRARVGRGRRGAGLQRLPQPLRVQLQGRARRRRRALKNKGLFQSLAEPNLIASNGKEASFLAGGEYPYPIAQPAHRARPSRSCSRSSASA